jgi:hypothetical protein
MRTNGQSFRGVISAVISIGFCGAFLLAMDLLKSVAGKNVAMGFSVFVAAVLVVCLISIWAGKRQR